MADIGVGNVWAGWPTWVPGGRGPTVWVCEADLGALMAGESWLGLQAPCVAACVRAGGHCGWGEQPGAQPPGLV